MRRIVRAIAAGASASAAARWRRAFRFLPETVRDVEVGTKSTFSLGDIRVRTNVALYRTWYDNVQRSVARLSPLSAAPLVITSIINAAKATVQGSELKLGISPKREFTLQGSLGIADAKYDEFNVVIPTSALTRKGEATSLSNVDFLNFQTTWSIGANYDKRLSHAGESVFGNIAYAHHSSGNYTNDEVPFPNPEGLIPASGELNASIGWNNIAGSNLSLRMFGENITNNTSLVYTFSLEQQVGFTSGRYNAPAM
jgi:iron complex outermembrane receptor protein